MTEQEWIASTDPEALRLETWPRSHCGEYGPRRYSDRKGRLAACALVRLRWDLVTNAKSRRCLEATEEVADDRFGERARGDWHEAATAALGVYDNAACNAARSAALLHPGDALADVIRHMRGVASFGKMAAVLRDICGNPFRPLPRWNTCPCEGEYCTSPSCDWGESPSWLTWRGGIIPALARRMYEERSFEDFPVLADMLTEAGCQNEEILMHLRGMGRCGCADGWQSDGMFKRWPCPRCDVQTPGWVKTDAPHVRGCFAIDLLLGKE